MPGEKEITTFCPKSRSEWRQWLHDNHISQQSVWLIYYKMKSAKFTMNWSEAVDEALCVGWIDSTRKPIDDETFMQFFCKRKPGSAWSKINKEKIQLLTENGLMLPAGIECVEKAKENGTWNMLDDVEALIIPKDLESEFRKLQGSRDFFLSLSKSVRKQILHWIITAKRPETRLKRIAEVASHAAQQLKPAQFR